MRFTFVQYSGTAAAIFLMCEVVLSLEVWMRFFAQPVGLSYRFETLPCGSGWSKSLGRRIEPLA
jgi:hypothetical protein